MLKKLKTPVLLLCVSLLGWRVHAYAENPRSDLMPPIVLGPQENTASIELLSAFIVARANSEEDKARAIFHWMTDHIAYDMRFYGNDQLPPLDEETPEAVVRRGRAVCEGYANLYDRLAKAAGLETEIIRGYELSQWIVEKTNPPTLQQMSHAWNQVKIDGQWKLLDATWGSGFVFQDSWGQERNDFYFMAPPEQFILTHFPLEERDQHLAHPIDLEEFTNYPLVTPQFFKDDLALGNQRAYVIQPESNEFTLTFNSRQDVTGLAKLDDSRSSVLVEHSAEGWQSVWVRLSKNGSFPLKIFTSAPELDPVLALQYEVQAKSITEEIPLEKIAFPKTTDLYQRLSVHLILPTFFHLKVGSVQTFDLKVPEAEEVVVVNGRKKTYLAHAGKGRFLGQITVQKGLIQVFASLPTTFELARLHPEFHRFPKSILTYNGD